MWAFSCRKICSTWNGALEKLQHSSFINYCIRNYYLQKNKTEQEQDETNTRHDKKGSKQDQTRMDQNRTEKNKTGIQEQDKTRSLL